MLPELDRKIYEWQLAVPGFGEAGQEKLRSATALISRAGGVGGSVAFSLAAAGIGKLILAHGGELRLDDLNRQILMRYEGVGKPRVESMVATLGAFNPRIAVETVAQNICEENVASLVGKADLVFSAAPLFQERLLMNRECVRQRRPLIDCSMYNLEGQIIPVLPGESACLACLYPEAPPHWQRVFPVFGAVAALAANIGAMEGIKLLAGFGEVNVGRMIYFNAGTSRFQTIVLKRNPRCAVCSEIS